MRLTIDTEIHRDFLNEVREDELDETENEAVDDETLMHIIVNDVLVKYLNWDYVHIESVLQQVRDIVAGEY